ncbi:ATP-binding cassette domain-containing protein [Planctomycetales bacterium ZRK34]|nr:ATP-binding cassette domain-containing protein [Planctomycetales bacterium ZRK34]
MNTREVQQPAICMQNVSVRRGPVTILKDIDWTLPRGANCALLGPNGSGKTTLMRVITGFMWPTTGTVDVLGGRLGRTDVRMLRRRVAVVDPSELYSVDGDLTALQVICTGFFGTLYLYDAVTEEQTAHAEQLLRAVGLSHRRDQRYEVLSTGEKRRCLLARALVHLPELLILDEPTAGLDVTGRERVLATIETLRRLHPELTVIMVTHHVEELSPRTDQVVLIRSGRLAAVGRPDAVITPERLTEVFGCKVFVQKRSGRWWLEVLPEAWLDLVEDPPES